MASRGHAPGIGLLIYWGYRVCYGPSSGIVWPRDGQW